MDKNLKNFFVNSILEVTAESPEKAALKARQMQIAPAVKDLYFIVQEEETETYTDVVISHVAKH
jgi:hypothetical protein